MNDCVIIVDNSNIWIEGMKLSAKIKKMTSIDGKDPCDSSWRIDSENKEKAVDTELVAKGVELICTTEPATLKILSGDSDFIPLVNIANGHGWETEMWAFSSAYQISGNMAVSVDRVQPLDSIFGEIGYTR